MMGLLLLLILRFNRRRTTAVPVSILVVMTLRLLCENRWGFVMLQLVRNSVEITAAGFAGILVPLIFLRRSVAILLGTSIFLIDAIVTASPRASTTTSSRAMTATTRWFPASTRTVR